MRQRGHRTHRWPPSKPVGPRFHATAVEPRPAASPEAPPPAVPTEAWPLPVPAQGSAPSPDCTSLIPTQHPVLSRTPAGPDARGCPAATPSRVLCERAPCPPFPNAAQRRAAAQTRPSCPVPRARPRGPWPPIPESCAPPPRRPSPAAPQPCGTPRSRRTDPRPGAAPAAPACRPRRTAARRGDWPAHLAGSWDRARRCTPARATRRAPAAARGRGRARPARQQQTLGRRHDAGHQSLAGAVLNAPKECQNNLPASGLLGCQHRAPRRLSAVRYVPQNRAPGAGLSVPFALRRALRLWLQDSVDDS